MHYFTCANLVSVSDLEYSPISEMPNAIHAIPLLSSPSDTSSAEHCSATTNYSFSSASWAAETGTAVSASGSVPCGLDDEEEKDEEEEEHP